MSRTVCVHGSPDYMTCEECAAEWREGRKIRRAELVWQAMLRLMPAFELARSRDPGKWPELTAELADMTLEAAYEYADAFLEWEDEQ